MNAAQQAHARRMRILAQMPPEDQQALQRAAMNATALRSLGEMGAWELVEAVGIFLAQHPLPERKIPHPTEER